MGADISIYFDGKAQAELTLARAPQYWRQNIPGVIDNLNQAFETYYTARSNVSRCTELGFTWDQRWAMQKELEECADNGWRASYYCLGFRSHIHCLRHAFEHFVENHDGWAEKESSVSGYKPGHPWSPYQPSATHGGINAPVAVQNFIDAFDSKLEEAMNAEEELKTKVQSMQKEGLGKLAYRFRQGESAQKHAAKESEKNLAEIIEKVEKINKRLCYTATWAQLQYCGKRWTDTVAELGESLEKCNKVVEQFITVGKVGNDLVEGVTTYSNAQNSGMSDGAALTLAVLERAMKCVPVLGDGYAEVVAGIPATAGFVRERAENLKQCMQRLDLE